MLRVLCRARRQADSGGRQARSVAHGASVGLNPASGWSVMPERGKFRPPSHFRLLGKCHELPPASGAIRNGRHRHGGGGSAGEHRSRRGGSRPSRPPGGRYRAQHRAGARLRLHDSLGENHQPLLLVPDPQLRRGRWQRREETHRAGHAGLSRGPHGSGSHPAGNRQQAGIAAAHAGAGQGQHAGVPPHQGTDRSGKRRQECRNRVAQLERLAADRPADGPGELLRSR